MTPHATAFYVLGLLPKCFCESVGLTPEPCIPSFRAAILEKMPLVQRGDPHVNEEGEEKQAGAQLVEDTAPVTTEPQVRRWEDLGKEDPSG